MDLLPNTALQRLRSGYAALGFGATHMRTVAAAHLALSAGYHWITIDLEHGVATLAESAQLCMAASAIGIAPIVRIGRGAFSDGTRLLDNGAQGVLVPDVRSADEARHVVDAFRYAPLGSRPWGANTFPFGYRAPRVPEAMQAINDELLLAVMIESTEGVRAVEDIAGVPGIDVVFVGASDLSIDLGHPGGFGEAAVKQAIDRVADACARAGKVLGLGGIYDQTWLAHYARRGARFIAGGNDQGFLLAAATERARQLEGVLAEVIK